MLEKVTDRVKQIMGQREEWLDAIQQSDFKALILACNKQFGSQSGMVGTGKIKQAMERGLLVEKFNSIRQGPERTAEEYLDEKRLAYEQLVNAGVKVDDADTAYGIGINTLMCVSSDLLHHMEHDLKGERLECVKDFKSACTRIIEWADEASNMAVYRSISSSGLLLNVSRAGMEATPTE